MNRHKKSNAVFTSGLLLLILSGCAGGGIYYSRIDSGALKKEDSKGVVDLSGAGHMDYSYTLPGFNESGKKEIFTFGVDEPLEEGSCILLDTKPIRGVVRWKIVQENEVPQQVLKAIKNSENKDESSQSRTDSARF